MDDIPVFRANKRRKATWQKDADTGPEDINRREHITVDSANGDSDDVDEVKVSDLLKLRKQNRSRGIGVKFSHQMQSQGGDDEPDGMALATIDSEEKLRDISNRFVGSTGQVVDVDKHMVRMAYIDSEMAKRQTTTTQTSSEQTTHQDANIQQSSQLNRAQAKPPEYPSQIQLSEFDLGPAAHEKNLALTSAAIARAQSGHHLPPQMEEESKPRRPRKPRLGRDGKPLRARARKQRNSEDLARDALVEQMLHEHRVEVYEGEAEADADVYEEDGDADERLAEQFKQEFLDAMAERQQKNQVKAATAAKAKGMGPEQTGPKLGGSRRARAKMALMQQQAQPQKGGGTGQK